MSSGINKHVFAPRLGGPYAWLVWSLAAIAFGYAFFHRVTPSVMVSDLMTEPPAPGFQGIPLPSRQQD